jgi:hypothetical protein
VPDACEDFKMEMDYKMVALANKFIERQRVDFERFIISRSIESHSVNKLELCISDGRYRNPTIQTLFVCWNESAFRHLERAENAKN